MAVVLVELLWPWVGGYMVVVAAQLSLEAESKSCTIHPAMFSVGSVVVREANWNHVTWREFKPLRWPLSVIIIFHVPVQENKNIDYQHHTLNTLKMYR